MKSLIESLMEVFMEALPLAKEAAYEDNSEVNLYDLIIKVGQGASLSSCINFVKETLAHSEITAEEKEKKSEVKDGRMTNSHEQIYGKKENVELSQLFSPLGKGKSTQTNTIPSMILIEGWAGIGKSVLCQFLANAWASDMNVATQ